MLYCPDCDKDVEFKSLDVGGKLTHFCPDCGESNLFKSKDEFQAGVDFVIETTRKFEEQKKEKLKRKDEITEVIIVKIITTLLIIFAIVLSIVFLNYAYK